MNKGSIQRLGIFVLLLALAVCPPVAAAPISGDLPIRFSADEMSHDQELSVTTAKGKVEVTHGDRILLADTISYNQKADLLTASGNITLLEPTGEVMFAQYMELSGDMKDGIIEDFRMILKDGARIAAAGGKRTAGRQIDMHRGVYSPCDLCVDDPSRPPLWQVKAVRVTHHSQHQIIEYRDAWLEVAGIPVAYTPYLFHPDPTAGRKTGLLAPSFGGSTDLGMIVRTPFYYNIAPNMDATITPMYVAKKDPVLAGEFRGKFDRADAEFAASITGGDKKSTFSTEKGVSGIRGHVAAKADFDIDDTWRWGFDVNHASDDTYMRRYGFAHESTLTSRAFAEGFRGRNYMAVNAYSFQPLSSMIDDDTSPLVLPMAEFSHVGQPSRTGARTSLDMNIAALSRGKGADSRRLAAKAGWHLPHVDASGNIYSLDAEILGAAYHVEDAPLSAGQGYTGFTGRVHPQLTMEWRHPLVRPEKSGKTYQMIEPMASLTLAPYGNNPKRIPNEDSRTFEFDDTNLFSANRFGGYDRVEGGPRLNYGMKWGLFGQSGGSTVVRVGQSYRLKDDTTFSQGSGLEDNFSDIVGSIQVSPGKYADIFYRTRFDKDNFTPKRNEVNMALGPDALRFSGSYHYFHHQADSEFETREQMSLGLSSRFTRFWRGTASGLYDMATSDMRTVFLGLTYEDECLTFATTARRDFYHDRDLKPSDAIMFTVTFKTLGDFRTGFSRDGN